MELNDLIKSNIFLICLYAGLILLIALIIYLVRNKAMKKALSDIDTEPDEIELDDNEGIVLIQKLKDTDYILENITSFNERYQGRFTIVNKPEEGKDFLNSTLKRDLKIKEFYEKTDSKLMFKFNTHLEEVTEE
jgi:hypothetical protein